MIEIAYTSVGVRLSACGSSGTCGQELGVQHDRADPQPLCVYDCRWQWWTADLPLVLNCGAHIVCPLKNMHPEHIVLLT